MEQSAYNWSDLQVGDMALDHSEQFFAQEHSKHERKVAHVRGIEPLSADETVGEVHQQLEDEQQLEKDLKLPVKEQEQQQHEESFATRLDQQRREVVLKNAQLHADNVAKHLNAMKISNKPWPKLQLKPPSWAYEPPQAYQFKDIYKQKKEMLLHRNFEEERKKREFRSRPMPNFQQVHEQQSNRRVVHRITQPVTPNVLKSSRAMQQKRSDKIQQLLRQREEEELKLRQQRPKVKPIPKSVKPLPLQPLKTPRQTQLAVKPFRFSTELRAQERKQFDEQAQQAQEQRRKQQEQQRQQRQQQEYKKQRELATFRASPNPFKTGELVAVTMFR